jgi:hypothetical protein
MPEAGLDGDFDLDNDVDGADFLIWQRGNLNPTDYANWKMNFGMVNAVPAAASVPEPSAAALMFFLGLAAKLVRTNITRSGKVATKFHC